MLGWHTSVYRRADDRSSPATTTSPRGPRLAVWQTRLGGLDWLKELVETGQAIDLGGDGYPRLFTATAGDMIPRIVDRPPDSLDTWISGVTDVVTEAWEGRTVIDRDVVMGCQRSEWLLVEAWDES